MKTISFKYEKIYIQDQVSFGEVKQWIAENCSGIVKYGVDTDILYAIFENKKDSAKFSLIYGRPHI